MAEAFAHTIDDFGGMVPRRANELLAPSAAVSAFNCRLLSGNLVGIHQLLYSEDLRLSDLYLSDSTPKAAFPIGSDLATFKWLPFASRNTHLVRGPIVNDAYSRYYWTGEGAPKYNTEARILNGDPALLLGVPAPVSVLTVAPAGGTPASSRAYTYTFVSPYGEEGPPAAPVVATGGEGTWALSGFDTAIPDMASRAPGTWKVRIYRTVPGSYESLFFYVDEMSLGTATYDDSISSGVVALNSVLESEDWEPPPAGLDYLVAHPNGFLLGFVGSDIYMSVPYRPHAWPQEYVLSTEFPIVALGVFGQSICVATKSNPYILSGVSPEAMTFTKTNSVVPCLSRYSLASFDFGVLYASERGLVAVDGTNVSVITEPLILGDQWKRTYRPEAIEASIRYDQQYLAFCACATDPEGNQSPGFTFSPMNEKAAFSRLDRVTSVDNLILNDLDGKLYVLRGGILYEWDNFETPPMQYRWRSKVFDFPRPVNVGALRVDMAEDAVAQELPEDDIRDFNEARYMYPLAPLGHAAFASVRAYNIVSNIVQNREPFAGSALRSLDPGLTRGRYQLQVWANDVLVFNNFVEADALVMLPSGFKASRWQFEVRAYDTIRSIEFGSSPKALGTT